MKALPAPVRDAPLKDGRVPNGSTDNILFEGGGSWAQCKTTTNTAALPHIAGPTTRKRRKAFPRITRIHTCSLHYMTSCALHTRSLAGRGPVVVPDRQVFRLGRSLVQNLRFTPQVVATATNPDVLCSNLAVLRQRQESVQQRKLRNPIPNLINHRALSSTKHAFAITLIILPLIIVLLSQKRKRQVVAFRAWKVWGSARTSNMPEIFSVGPKVNG